MGNIGEEEEAMTEVIQGERRPMGGIQHCCTREEKEGRALFPSLKVIIRELFGDKTFRRTERGAGEI